MHMAENFNLTVLRRIRDEMTKKKLSQQDVADLLQWTQTKVSQKLNGRSETTLNEFEALCFAVGLSKVEAIRDQGLEFVAELTPSEVRMFQRLRQMPPVVWDAVSTLLKVQETTPVPLRGAGSRRSLFGKSRHHPN